MTTTTAPVALRPATAADERMLRAWFLADKAAELGPLPAALLELQWSARQVEYARRHPAAETLVIEASGPIGALIVDRAADATHLVDLVVAAAHRGRGYATAALEALIGEGRELTLEVWAENTVARSLYERLGFETVGGGVYLSMRRAAASDSHVEGATR